VRGGDPHVGLEFSEVHDIEGRGQGLLRRGQPAQAGIGPPVPDQRERGSAACVNVPASAAAAK
ncbi:MAG TPA: hypothetical protein VGL33_19130, partial [Streptosporangiaceae bacterium]